MKNKNLKAGKLNLNKTTLKQLNADEMAQLNGGWTIFLIEAAIGIAGIISYQAKCPTTNPGVCGGYTNNWTDQKCP